MKARPSGAGDELVSTTLVEILIFLTFVFVLVLGQFQAKVAQATAFEAAVGSIDSIAEAIDTASFRHRFQGKRFPEVWHELVARSALERDLTYDDLLKRYREVIAERNAIAGQNEALKTEAARGGRDFAPCWASRDGSPEAAFIAIIRDEGILLQPAWNEARETDAMNRGMAMLTGAQVPFSRFGAHVQSIYGWSVRERCRHYARIIDSTGATSKTAYKRGSGEVLSRFYQAANR